MCGTLAKELSVQGAAHCILQRLLDLMEHASDMLT